MVVSAILDLFLILVGYIFMAICVSIQADATEILRFYDFMD